MPRSSTGAIWVQRSRPPLKTSPAAAPVAATAASASPTDSTGAAATTPSEATEAAASPQPMARSGRRRGRAIWLSAPETSTRNPAAPTRA